MSDSDSLHHEDDFYYYLMNNEDKLQGVNLYSVLVDSDTKFLDVDARDDYIVVPDPMADSAATGDEWCVILLKEPYTDFLIRFTNIMIQGKDIQFDYVPLYIPGQNAEVDHIEFLNYLNNVLQRVMANAQQHGALTFRDKEGKEVEQ